MAVSPAEITFLTEDGETALAELAEKAQAAGAVMATVLAEERDRTWTMGELYEETRDRGENWRATVLSIAFSALMDGGLLWVDDAQLVHAR